MPVITSDFCFRIDAFQQFNSRLVIRVLRYKFAMNGKVEDCALGLFDCSLQIIFIILDYVQLRKTSHLNSRE